MAKQKQKQKQKEPEEQKVEVPAKWSVAVTLHMAINADRWEEAGNTRMAECIRDDIKQIEKKRHEFKLENGLIEPVKPKTKKKKPREYKGDANSKLIEQAIEALTSSYEGELIDNDTFIQKRIGPTPTSVELFSDYAKVWFEFFEEDSEEGTFAFDWSYYLTVPIYHFWGKKKREKYLKEQRQLRDEAAAKRANGPTPGREDKIKISDFLMMPEEKVIVMPANMDQSRLIKHSDNTKTDFDRSYVAYSGSRYDEDQNAHACVFNAKEGYDFMVETLIDWYG